MLDETPTGALPTLRDHIKRFEIPRPDGDFTAIISALVDEAERRSQAGSGTAVINARYFYLLGRAYELLGYSARHTPWLSNSPRFYWQKARDFLDEAKLLVSDAAAEHFLHGKLLYRAAMIYTLDVKTEDDDLLTQAEAEFDAAARLESDRSMRYINLDAAWIARTERELRAFKKDLQIVLGRSEKYAGSALLRAIVERLSGFPEPGAWEFPSAAAGMDWPVQHALAKVRLLYSRAQVHEEVVRCLRGMQTHLQDETFGGDALKEWERIIEASYRESADVCEGAGLAVRAADSRVTLLWRRAEAALRHCVHEFKVARIRDNEQRARLLDRAPASARPRLLPADALPALRALSPEQDPVRIPAAVLSAAVTVDLPLDEHATVYAESANVWLILNGPDRYLVQPNEGYLEVVDLGKQPIPFSHNEAETFETYSRAVHETCELYTIAIREILQLLQTAKVWYQETTTLVEIGTIATSDVHLGSLYVTVLSTLKEVSARNYPLLSTLRVRTLYAWSLLEMFQMRNQSVRLGTLFSGQCQLIMANPFFKQGTDTEDQHLEVGADPIFRTTVDFLFRGAKGEGNRHDFQRRALRTTLITIGQQEQSLLIEGRSLNLDPETRRALLARLSCHRSLARALEQFTDIFVAQRAGDLPTDEIRTALREIARHFTEAKAALDGCGDYRSKLIDAAGLDGLHDYMRGIALVLIGMNEREKKRDWAAAYRNALSVLQSAKRKLIEAGDVYLLPSGSVRRDYLNYVDARILTVSAFQARYHGEQDNSPSDFAKAADLFAQAAGVFENLHDYRVATKARARAADAKSPAADSHAERYRCLKEANALYAACADAPGYKDTSERLQSDFAEEEAGLSSTTATAATRPSVAAAPSAPQETSPERFGLYAIKFIASGGMADVYHATGPDGRTFALKRLRTQDLGNQEMRQRLQREYDIASRLKHPNIIDVYSYDDVSGVPYLTMELLEGEPLETAVAAHQIFDPQVAAGVVIRISAALDHAHRNGVIHRDLTPSNVMVLKHGGVKVMDFGIARDDRFARMTTVGTFLGTTQYASPEQLQLRPTTPSSDLYSLGLIFFEMLTGTAGLDRHQRLTLPHPAPSTVIAEVPQVLDRIVLKLVERDAGNRYASAEELIAELAAFVRQ